MRFKFTLFLFLIAAFMLATNSSVFGQGVTNSAISGTVLDNAGNALPAATILANHIPSGTQYGTTTRDDGRFSILNMRVGGPYTVSVSYVGYQKQEQENIFLSLGITANLEFILSDASIELGEVTVIDRRTSIFSAERTGASTSIDVESLEMLPTITRRIGDFTRLTPQAIGNSFAGQDNRLNNITVDGSYFNNSFGLAGQPGDRTNVAPISLDAIEQIQVSIAPYDVRQGNFVGAGVNTVTRSGTNEFSGSVYYHFRHQGLVGTDAADLKYNPGKFQYNQIGVRVGGPIIPNKLFFFTSFEDEKQTQPGTTFSARSADQTAGGSVTRVLASDLNQLSSFLRTNFGYETGPYQGYDHEIPATRFLLKFDYNLDQKNKFSLRYTHLDSQTDVLVSTSSSLGFGGRRGNTNALNFQNSNYIILENIRSIVGEWNSNFGDNISNNMIVGYTYNDESRDSRGTFFPLIEVLEGGLPYTTFGFEPFTPNNELRYKSFQFQNNLTMFLKDHYLTFGLSAERYESENVFFPGSQSVYVYNSLADFYADANGFLQDPNRDTSTVTLNRFQVRWTNIPGQTKPVQPLEVLYAGVYAQDEWHAAPNLRLTLGIRADVPFFSETGFKNANADALTFRDENGNPVKYQTDKLPDPNILLSPRVGFNWDITGERTTQIRGGTGIFTGKPAYVWISNQIGNTGVLTGFESLTSTRMRPFNPDPNRYKQTPTGNPAGSYELALTDPDFKFPQLWRSNLAVDQRLPFDLIATAELLYSRDVNGLYYINANLPAPQANFTGVDNRPRWTNNRINNTAGNQVSNAIVLKNQNEGYSWNASFALEKPFSNGWFAKAAYSYGETRNTVDPGSIASGSFLNNQHSGDPNNPGLAYSAAQFGGSPGHRVFAAISYRKEYFDFGATTISLFWQGLRHNVIGYGNYSYTFSGDLNGDGGSSNDLIYIPSNASEMNFEQYTTRVNGQDVIFTVQQQIDAWNAYIESDDYLKENRGKYAERGAAFLPMVFRADLSIVQEVFTNLLQKRNTLQFRVDLLNVGNLINKDWGVGERYNYGSNSNVQPLISRGADSEGKVLYRFRNSGSELDSRPLVKDNTSIDNVFQIQFSVRYIFN